MATLRHPALLWASRILLGVVFLWEQLRHGRPVGMWASRILLGVVFLWAAFYKITDLPAFAANIGNYGIVPTALLPLFATVLAGIEVVTGLALVTGVWRKGAALIVTGMLVMFIVALTAAYVQGKSIECGCFTKDLSTEKASEIRALMLRRIVEDVGLLLLSANLLWQELARTGAPGLRANNPHAETT